MKKFALFLIGLLFVFNTSAQNVELVSGKPNKKAHKVNKNFEWISPKTDLDNIGHIGVFRMLLESNGSNGMDMSFYNLRKSAQNLGANTYKITKIEHEGKKIIVIVNVYYLNRGQMLKNLEHYERNYVSLIGNINTNSPKPHRYYINEQMEEVSPFTYKHIVNEDGNMLRLKVKEKSDTPMSIFGKPNNLGTFVTQGDVHLGIPIDLDLAQAAYSITIKNKLETNGMILYKLGFARFAIDILDYIKDNDIDF